jgi:hypothetical protein
MPDIYTKYLLIFSLFESEIAKDASRPLLLRENKN